MWTSKYRSFFLLIRIRAEHLYLTIPFPLFLLDQTLDALADLAWFWERINPGFFQRIINDTPRFHANRNSNSAVGSIAQVFTLCRQIVAEIRQYGNWRMVAVESDDHRYKNRKIRVYIDFI